MILPATQDLQLANGVVGVGGGAAALGGLALAPVTGVLSLVLTVGGVIAGLAAGGTGLGLGATIAKDVGIRMKVTVVKNLLDSLQKKDED